MVTRLKALYRESQRPQIKPIVSRWCTLAYWLGNQYFRLFHVRCSYGQCDHTAVLRIRMTNEEQDAWTQDVIVKHYNVYFCQQHTHEYSLLAMLPYDPMNEEYV